MVDRDNDGLSILLITVGGFIALCYVAIAIEKLFVHHELIPLGLL